MSKQRLSHNHGSILILALWTLGFLVVLAIQLSHVIRQKITFLERLESRSQALHTAQAGVKKAIVMLEPQRNKTVKSLTVADKQAYLNNPDMMSNIKLGNFVGEVSYLTKLDTGGGLVKRFGFIDEASKLNVNVADLDQIKTVLIEALGMDQESAYDIASAIVDWRTPGKSELVGFYSDEYYERLKYPYVTKDAPFQVLDELMLVRGVSEPIFDKMANFLTVYGNGVININTASAPVLTAIGINPYLVDKIIAARRGRDDQEATEDDIIFPSPEYIILTLNSIVEVTPAESQLLDDLVTSGKLVTDGGLYFIHGTGATVAGKQKKLISCVLDPQNGRIHYWREK